MRLGGTKLIAATACAFALLASPAFARTIDVTTTADEFGVGPGCSLREAITAAQRDVEFGGCKAGNGADTIRLTGGDTYVRTLGGLPENGNASGDYDVRGEVTISVVGPGRATIDAGGLDRVLQVLPDGKLTASRLILTGGAVAAAEPGGDTSGGGIADAGALQLSRSRITGNQALGITGCACGGGLSVTGASAKLSEVSIDANAARGAGGGIAFTGGRLSVDKSTLDSNASAGGGGGAYLAGDAGLNTAVFTSSTISRNTDSGNAPSSGGGGIFAANLTDATFHIINSTVADNSAEGSGGAVWVTAGTVQLDSATVAGNVANSDGDATGRGGGIAGQVDANNSIVAANFDASATAPRLDCGAGANVTHGLLIRGDGCHGFHNRHATDPELGDLRFNGGPTETIAIGRTSRARDHAGTPVPPLDQRGRRRDSRPDIGAYEYLPPTSRTSLNHPPGSALFSWLVGGSLGGLRMQGRRARRPARRSGCGRPGRRPPWSASARRRRCGRRGPRARPSRSRGRRSRPSPRASRSRPPRPACTRGRRPPRASAAASASRCEGAPSTGARARPGSGRARRRRRRRRATATIA